MTRSIRGVSVRLSVILSYFSFHAAPIGALVDFYLILEVGETTLVTLPVIWFSLHPVKPGQCGKNVS